MHSKSTALRTASALYVYIVQKRRYSSLHLGLLFVSFFKRLRSFTLLFVVDFVCLHLMDIHVDIFWDLCIITYAMIVRLVCLK